MTLNQIINRLKAIVTAHQMVRGYDLQGLDPEFNNEKDALYPSANLMVQPGIISSSKRYTSYAFTLTLEDLVHVSSDTKTNEWDVVSDMSGIAEDILAQLNSPVYGDWNVSADNQIRFLFDNENDRTAGVVVDFVIQVLYTSNRCQIPTDQIIETIKDENVKVYDLEYIATGNEGSILTIAALLGKKIILITREMSTLHKVSNSPDPAEFAWNDTDIALGTPVNQGERFLILYRNY